MASVHDILRRFRFHGVPGAPKGFGVPADRAAEAESELRPLFALLASDEAAAGEFLSAARREAQRRRGAADAQAKAILAQAHEAAPSLRAAEMKRILSEATRERDELLADGQLEVERIERRVAEQLRGVVAEVVEGVLAMGAETR
jgi:vacuolar-type H+-ATPase subunit H